MRSFLALCIAAALSSGVSADCDACLDGQCYRTHLLPGVKGTKADIDRNTNTLYVIDERRYRLKQCDLDTATCSDTALQLNISSVAVDQRTGDIYGSVYGARGIYKLDLINNKTFLLSHDGIVGHMAFKDKLYYCKMDAYGIFTLERGGTSRLIAGLEKELLFYIFVDKKGDIYYSDDENKHVLRSPNYALDLTHSWDIYFYVSVDKNGDAVFINWYTNAVYRVINREMVEIGAIAMPIHDFNPMFDRDNNLVYTTDDKKHYHLKRDSNSQCKITDVFSIIEVINGASAKPSVLSLPIMFIFPYLSYLLSKHPWTSFSC